MEKTGLNRTTIYRNIVTLEENDLLMKNERDKSYKLGPMGYHLGSVYLQNVNYEENILNILENIAKESKESVGLARREGNKVVSIYSVEIHQPVKNPLVIGIGIPLYGSTGDVRNVVSISFFKEENYLQKMEILKELLFRYKKELEKFIV